MCTKSAVENSERLYASYSSQEVSMCDFSCSRRRGCALGSSTCGGAESTVGPRDKYPSHGRVMTLTRINHNCLPFYFLNYFYYCTPINRAWTLPGMNTTRTIFRNSLLQTLCTSTATQLARRRVTTAARHHQRRTKSSSGLADLVVFPRLLLS
jgi:hypothetical protein